MALLQQCLFEYGGAGYILNLNVSFHFRLWIEGNLTGFFGNRRFHLSNAELGTATLSSWNSSVD